MGSKAPQPDHGEYLGGERIGPGRFAPTYEKKKREVPLPVIRFTCAYTMAPVTGRAVLSPGQKLSREYFSSLASGPAMSEEALAGKIDELVGERRNEAVVEDVQTMLGELDIDMSLAVMRWSIFRLPFKRFRELRDRVWQIGQRAWEL